MIRDFRSSLTLLLLLMLITGLGYPFLILGLGKALFFQQAEGSLIEENGKIIGSTLIGQNFISDAYFHPRPSYAGQGYDASNSSGSNLSPGNPAFAKAVSDRIAAIKNPETVMPVPVDLVTGSASGLDPDISVAAAKYQAVRIATIRNLDMAKVNELIAQHTQPRTLGILGEVRVNVLELNRALDQLAPKKPTSP